MGKISTWRGMVSFVLSVLGVLVIFFQVWAYLFFSSILFFAVSIVFSVKQEKIKRTGWSIGGFIISLIGFVIIFLLIYALISFYGFS